MPPAAAQSRRSRKHGLASTRTTGTGAQNLAALLGGAGRPEEAVALLDPAVPANRSVLAAHLVELGRIKDAVALLQQSERAVRPLPWNGDDLPF
ncbi:hypothetical protein ACWCQS_12460 [Streptomyces sp. NPDC002076]